MTAKQPELFATADDAYTQFPDIPENNYPRGLFKPLHPAFNKRGNVTTPGKNSRRFYVDLTIGECNCPRGFGFGYDEKRNKSPWYSAAYCSHKLRMICSIIDSYKPGVIRAGMEQAYIKAVGTKYNKYEVVSAFHKELRRGDFELAWHFGLMLGTKRATRGVFKYMLNIVYEETRDHQLAEHLINMVEDESKQTMVELARTIAWFCASKKKWELPARLAIFTDEMLGYEALSKKYGWDVAKGGNIIPADQKGALVKLMRDGAKTGNRNKFQQGLKGLQKLVFTTKPDGWDEPALAAHRQWLYGELYDIADSLPETHDVWAVIATINKRIESGMPPGYHELNVIGDALTGESYSAGLLTPATLKALRTRPLPPVRLGFWPLVPLYAHDNHDYTGKALMRRYPQQLQPGAKQTDLDFRICGAYFGVAWRMLAFNQHSTIGTSWETVKWPTALFRIVNAMWY